jgi:hypothetical protein
VSAVVRKQTAAVYVLRELDDLRTALAVKKVDLAEADATVREQSAELRFWREEAETFRTQVIALLRARARQE